MNDALIGRVAEAVTLPVNVMVMDGVPSNGRLSELGVARISYVSKAICRGKLDSREPQRVARA